MVDGWDEGWPLLALVLLVGVVVFMVAWFGMDDASAYEQGRRLLP